MWKNIGLEKCFAFIASEIRHGNRPISLPTIARPVITISRLTGAGGHTIASTLADYLQAKSPCHARWAIFDQNLVEKVLEDHHLQKHIANFMQERHESALKDTLEEWMGLHPSSWTLVHQTNATVLHLAQTGNVILLGRGANVITRKLNTAFHVRVVGSLDKRIERVEHLRGVDRKGACRYIKKTDEGRKQYLKDNFDADIDDPLLYHLIINVDFMGHDQAARLIGDEVIRRFRLDRPAETVQEKTA